MDFPSKNDDFQIFVCDNKRSDDDQVVVWGGGLNCFRKIGTHMAHVRTGGEMQVLSAQDVQAAGGFGAQQLRVGAGDEHVDAISFHAFGHFD